MNIMDSGDYRSRAVVFDVARERMPHFFDLELWSMVKAVILGFERFFAALFETVGELTLLLFQTVAEVRHAHRRVPAILAQMVEIGWNTLPLAALIGLFTGMVMALQTGYALTEFSMLDRIGPVVGLSMIREMGPVITAVLVAGRVGSAMAAEIGTMAVTDEIDALRTMGINPVSYLVLPRFLAALVMQPALTVFNMTIGIWGGQVIATSYFGVTAQRYYHDLFEMVVLVDLTGGMLKTVVFGALIAVVSCYMGLKTRGGVAGVGRSTTTAVVISLILIFIANFFITRFYGLN